MKVQRLKFSRQVNICSTRTSTAQLGVVECTDALNHGDVCLLRPRDSPVPLVLFLIDKNPRVDGRT